MRYHYARLLSEQLGLPETAVKSVTLPVRTKCANLAYITALAWEQKGQNASMSRWLRGIPS